MQAHTTNNRIAFFAFALFLGVAVACLQLFRLQLVERSFLLDRARNQQLHSAAIPAARGPILDRNGVILAESARTESVFLNRRQAVGKAALVGALSRTLRVSPAGLWARLRTGKSFWVKRNAPLEQTSVLKKYRFGCLSFFPQSRRVYPQSRLACHVLGFTNVDGRGLEGIERQYDAALAGKPGRMMAAKDARGKALLADNVIQSEAEEGSSVTLTLDAQLQHITERELAKACEKYRAKWAGMVVMDPANGEILALANVPDYDPNHPAKFTQAERRNRAVTDAFEPGSTFKLVTACLALENKVVRPDTLIDCHHGRAEFLGRVVRDHEDKLGVVPFTEVIAQSSNIGTVSVALKLDRDVFYQGARRFGWGQKTGIDLPGEAPGVLRPPRQWSGISMAALPFGQELSGNILHVACCYAALANGGRKVWPHLIKDISGPSGWSDLPGSLRPSRGPRIIPSSVRGELVEILKQVVDHGTGTPAALPGFLVAGKTGTAEKIDPATHHYAVYKNLSSFAGFVPADNPRFVCVVVLDEPRDLTLGGWVCGPVFRDACAGMLAAYKVDPDPALLAGRGAQAGIPRLPGEPESKPVVRQAMAEPGRVQVPDLASLSGEQARRAVASAGLKAVIQGSGRSVASQFPKAGCWVYAASPVHFLLGEPDPPADAKKTVNRGVKAIVSTF